jgi:hypothetical protein
MDDRDIVASWRASEGRSDPRGRCGEVGPVAWLRRTAALVAVAGLSAAGCGGAGVPVEQECMAAALYCSGNALMQCSEDGTEASLVEHCESGCLAGQCQDTDAAGDVTTGDAALDAPEGEGTKPDVALQETEAGDAAADADTGCGQCAPGAVTCVDGKFVSTCAPGPDGCGVWSEPESCHDFNPCTDDSCVEGQGCLYNNNKMLCDDQDPCTSPDVCNGGLCQPGPSQCECKQHADCAAKDDANKCNGTFKCLNYICVPDGSSAVVCPPPQSPCDEVSCVPETGLCIEKPLPSGSACDDGDDCTVDDTCNGSTCAGLPMVCESADPQCSQAYCLKGACVSTNVQGSCDDGDPETCKDKCVDGVCKGSGCGVVEGETCLDAIDLGGAGSFEADLCDYTHDLNGSPCSSIGPDVFFKVKPNSMSGYVTVDTAGSTPNTVVALRLWSEADCQSGSDFGCGGVSWGGGLGLTNYLFFSVSTTDGSCGIVKISATVVNL